MSQTDLNERFTNENYSSRFEVAKSLGTNLIDQIWFDILTYRKNISRELGIYDKLHVHYTLTLTQKVNSVSNEIGEKSIKFINAYQNLGQGSLAKLTLSHDMLKLALKNVAKANNIDISDITLQSIIEHKCENTNYKIIINYFNALDRLLSNPYEEIGEEFLANYYGILLGQEELTSFYRVTESNSKSSKFLVDPEFDNGVPVRDIEELMAVMLTYVSDKNQPIVNRIVAVFYMFNYVKPFDNFNLELASILAKRILGSTGIDAAVVYVPLEITLNNRKFFNEISREVQKSHDFTYAFFALSENIKDALMIALDRIVQVNSNALEQVFNIGDDAKKIKEEFGIEMPKPIVEEPKVIPTPAVKPTISTYVETKPITDLSEKELKAREVDMLESDPFIKKGQAHFYVRHCTKGKYYTIQQYKKFEGCVYETARTSMDNLALRGYYRREQFKNKFVYTPIDKE